MVRSIRMWTSLELLGEGKAVTAVGRRSRWRSMTRTLMKVLPVVRPARSAAGGKAMPLELNVGLASGPALFASSLPTKPAVDTRNDSGPSELKPCCGPVSSTMPGCTPEVKNDSK